MTMARPALARRRRLDDFAAVRPGSVLAFAMGTCIASVAVLLLLPGVTGAAVVVFIPTLLAIALTRRDCGPGSVRNLLFSARSWRTSLSWALGSIVVALVMRLGVSLIARLIDPTSRWDPGSFSPLLVAVFVFAAGEEIGWRGFALPALLARGMHPLTSALLLGAPWALLHLPLTAAGQMSEGTPPLALLITILSLGVILSWSYLGGGLGLLAPVLLHGGQNALAVLNGGSDAATLGWSMAAVYGVVAALIVVLTGGRLGMTPRSGEV